MRSNSSDVTANGALTAEVVAALGDRTQRQVRNAVRQAVSLLRGGDLEGGVCPWDLAAPRRGSATLGDVSTARAIHLVAEVLVAELLPSGKLIAQRRIEHGWRLARFVSPGVTTLPRDALSRTVQDSMPLARSS
jgi:hypothetical protein